MTGKVVNCVMIQQIVILGILAFVGAQKIGHYEPEVHPKLSWKRCKGIGSCQPVKGEVVVDSNWRWLHVVDDYHNCFGNAKWDNDECDSVDACTNNCALEGANYPDSYGIITQNDSISLPYKTYYPYDYNLNSRVFLMENEDKYQMFTLLNNEVAVDVDLSSVECGINAALYFVAMEPDGGLARYPTNKAGAKYGTGYCDASCPRSNRFNGGKANYDDWIPSETDKVNGVGLRGACCPEFDILNSNAHSFFMSSKPCRDLDYEVCEGSSCDPEKSLYPDDRLVLCDKYGCEYQPYRLGNKEFYGRNKTLNTNKKFTIVTRFDEKRVTQFFIQDGKKIEVPSPKLPGFPPENGITNDYCKAKVVNFDDKDRFTSVGGFEKHIDALRRPMVMAMSITDDHWGHNLWLDSIWTPDRAGLPGTERGPCDPEFNDPANTGVMWPDATVTWSNIRFGPIGSTVKL